MFCLCLVFYLKRVSAYFLYFLFLFASLCKQSFNNNVFFFCGLVRIHTHTYRNTRKIIKKDYCGTTSIIIIIIVRYMNEHFPTRYLHDVACQAGIIQQCRENNKKIHVSLDLWPLIKSYGLFFLIFVLALLLLPLHYYHHVFIK